MASSTTPLTLHFVVPGDLATATGGYAYARELLAAWRRAGREVVVHPLPDGFPLPSPDDRAAAAATFAALPDGATVIVDGLAFGALPALAACHGRRLKLIALVHHPLALETGLAPPLAARLRDDERQALAQARAVIVTSATTAATLAADYAVAPERITIVEPGVRIAATARDRHRPWQESAPTDQSAGHGAAVAGKAIDLLCVATLTPRKGHPVLFDALASIDPALRWRLLCIGSATRDPGHAARLRAQCEARGLSDRVTLAGEVDAATLERAWCGADAFVLASHHEGYGMVLAEAVAHGLPIVATRAGATGQTVPAGAGVLVPAGDVPALAAALTGVIGDHALRAGLAAAARAAALRLPGWDTAAARLAACVDSLAGSPAGPPAEEPGEKPAGFSAEWLALREPYDHAARAAALTRQLAMRLAQRPPAARSRPAAPLMPLRVLDLGCGSGSNLRYLAPRLGRAQHWRLVDHDPALLAALGAAVLPAVPVPDGEPAPVAITPIACDLARDLATLPWDDVDLVTGSALLDLVSDRWLAQLVAAVRTARPALLFALSYDGMMRWAPALPDDGWVLAAFNAHQTGDKGFGPALGPAAAESARARLLDAGYLVRVASTPWRFGPADVAIQTALATGAVAALAPAAPDARGRLDGWLARRLAAITAGRSALVVGHRDLLALPRADRNPRARRSPSGSGGTAAADSPPAG